MNFDMSKSKEIIGEANQLEAVKQNGDAIQYIHNPSEQVQLEAVKQDGNAIQYFKYAWIKNQTKKMTVTEIEELLGHKVEIIAD